MSDLAVLVGGAMAGGALCGLIAWFMARAKYGSHAAALQSSLTEVRLQLSTSVAEVSALRGELDNERRVHTDAAARLDEAHKSLERQRGELVAIEAKISDTFKSISLDALSRNSEEFLKMAQAQADKGSRELNGKKELIDQSIGEMSKKLIDVQRRVEDIGRSSIEKIGDVAKSVRTQAEATETLSITTDSLRRTLASARKRGEWGERMAEDIIRLTGMAEGINYIKQKAMGETAGRPDYTFLLPNDLKINMDVKFPMDNYLHYLEAETDHDKKRFRDDLLRNVRTMIKGVTSREYIDPANHTVDYVIIFIPNEQVYGFINESNVTLIDEALKQKVVLCSPFTLYAVLAVVRQSVDNFNLELTASEILKLLGEFFKQWNNYKERFKVLGERLDSTRKEYDALVTTRTNMLERPLRKIDDIRRQKAILIDEQPGLE